ncbi:MAG: hypothetical protein ACYS0D_15365 [Planctomycetota bacterium]
MIEEALATEARRLDAEQAVRGLDALDELLLHPILARGLESHFGVFSEERYPADRTKRDQSEGERCDLVLTPDGRDLAQPDRAPTLFDAPDPVGLDEAYWLEVKTVCQFALEGPNAGYASALMAAVREDVAKLAHDPGIRHAGLLVIIFAADEQVAAHDLDVAMHRALDRGLPLGAPYRRSFDITDRHGNRTCMAALIPVNRD